MKGLQTFRWTNLRIATGSAILETCNVAPKEDPVSLMFESRKLVMNAVNKKCRGVYCQMLQLQQWPPMVINSKIAFHKGEMLLFGDWLVGVYSKL